MTNLIDRLATLRNELMTSTAYSQFAHTVEEARQELMRHLRRELDDHDLAVQDVARRAWNEAVDAAAVIAFDMLLESREERHAYRWNDTEKAMAWDISHAIRKRLSAPLGY